MPARFFKHLAIILGTCLLCLGYFAFQGSVQEVFDSEGTPVRGPENVVWRVCKERAPARYFQKVVVPRNETRTVERVTYRRVYIQETAENIWIEDALLCSGRMVSEKAVIVDTYTNELFVVQGDQTLGRFPVGTGRVEDGFESPLGIFRFEKKERCPVYYGTNPAEPLEGCAAENPLGVAALWFQGRSYGLHGTSQPQLISATATTAEDRRVSKGCLRLNNRHVNWLYPLIQTGNQIWIMHGMRNTVRGGEVHVTGLPGRRSLLLVKLEPGTREVILEQRTTGALFRVGGGDDSKFRFYSYRLPVGSFQGSKGFRTHFITENIALSSR